MDGIPLGFAYVNQQWPYNSETQHGALEFHEHLIPNSPAWPLRIWIEVGDRDLFNPNIMCNDMHDWVVAMKKPRKFFRPMAIIFSLSLPATQDTFPATGSKKQCPNLWNCYGTIISLLQSETKCHKQQLLIMALSVTNQLSAKGNLPI
jgi:hypothetical protein